MKKIIEKKRTVLNTSLSYFDAAWARAREIRLHPDTTIAIKKEVKLLFQFLFKRREQDRQRLGKKNKNSLHFLFFFFLARFNLLLQKKKKKLSSFLHAQTTAPQPVRLRHHPGRVHRRLPGQHPALRLRGPRRQAVVGRQRRAGG